VRGGVATAGGSRAHFDGTCDGELAGPHEREEVEDVRFRYLGVSEVEQYFEYRSSWSLDVLIHFILYARISVVPAGIVAGRRTWPSGLQNSSNFSFSIGSSVKCRRSSKKDFRGTAVKSRVLRKSWRRVTVRLIT
jgi:hypothetical protein